MSLFNSSTTKPLGSLFSSSGTQSGVSSVTPASTQVGATASGSTPATGTVTEGWRFGSSTNTTGVQPLTTSIFGSSSNAPTSTQQQSVSLFGGTAPTQQQQEPTPSKSIFTSSTSVVPSAAKFRSAESVPNSTNLGLGGFSSGLGLSRLELGGVPISSTGTKKFLPGRPSLQDILAVAPQWKCAFDDINKELSERDDNITKLKTLLKDLRSKNETQKIQLDKKLAVAKAQRASQNWIESEIDSLQPAITKLQRQCASLSSSCERTIGGVGTTGSSGSSSNRQPLIVPQPEYLRFIADLNQRAQALQQRADLLCRSVLLLSDELRSPSLSPMAEIKTTLTYVRM